jgi:hypothetical protein
LGAVSGPWWGSDGGGFYNGFCGSDGGPEGVSEPVLRGFLYSFIVVFGTVLFFYQDYS